MMGPKQAKCTSQQLSSDIPLSDEAQENAVRCLDAIRALFCDQMADKHSHQPQMLVACAKPVMTEQEG